MVLLFDCVPPYRGACHVHGTDMNISDALEFLNNRIQFHQSRAKRFNRNSHPSKQHERTAQQHRDLITLLKSLQVNATQKPVVSNETAQDDLFSLNPLKLDDLPEELVDDLNLSKSERRDAEILELFKIAERPLNINELMVGLYRKYEQRPKRNALSARLYRMAQRDDVHSVPHKKGLYAIGPLEEENLDQSDD